MLRCSKEAFARCPTNHLCGRRDDATYREGSECDCFNQEVSSRLMTNSDWIRAMSDKELVKFIGHNSLCDRIQREGTWCEEHAVCTNCLVEWLRQPAEPTESPDEDDRDSGLVEEE